MVAKREVIRWEEIILAKTDNLVLRVLCFPFCFFLGVDIEVDSGRSLRNPGKFDPLFLLFSLSIHISIDLSSPYLLLTTKALLEDGVLEISRFETFILQLKKDSET